jgi:UDP-N-acetylmuramoyl-tripeptide--D-alanyl-D-alanine ligase
VVVIKVTDTLKALGDLAGYYRWLLNCPVIAVTGSNGKTTTKDMLAHILSRRGPTASSSRSFNNYIGLPLTIFSIEPRHRYAVLELGANRPGEIAYLARIARPDTAIITNIAPAHLEELKSLKGIAREKVSLFEYLAPGGTGIYNAGSKLIKKFIPKAENRIETFSINPVRSEHSKVKGDGNNSNSLALDASNGVNNGGAIRAVGIKNIAGGITFHVSVRGDRRVYACRLPVIGDWNVNNALAAITAAWVIGVPVKESCRALSDFKAPPMRMERRTLKGVTYINDAYNANPSAVACALQALTQQAAGRRIFVFGEMRELGRDAGKYHRAVARDVIRAEIDGLICVGPATRATLRALPENKPSYRVYCHNVEQAINCLNRIVQKGDTILLKGSRAIGLEKILT